MDTARKGFYVNKGKLEFKSMYSSGEENASDDDSDDDRPSTSRQPEPKKVDLLLFLFALFFFKICFFVCSIRVVSVLTLKICTQSVYLKRDLQKKYTKEASPEAPKTASAASVNDSIMSVINTSKKQAHVDSALRAAAQSIKKKR